MISIRNEQIDAFSPQDDEDIIIFIIEHLNNEHYEYISEIPLDTLHEMAHNALIRSRSYNINEFEDIVVFISLMFVMAPNFSEEPQFKNILSDKKITATEKIDKLLADGFDSNWKNVQKNYNGDAWFPELKNKESA